jgi:hypothetical protein
MLTEPRDEPACAPVKSGSVLGRCIPRPEKRGSKPPPSGAAARGKTPFRRRRLRQLCRARQLHAARESALATLRRPAAQQAGQALKSAYGR